MKLKSHVVTWPLPDSEMHSPQFRLDVERTIVPVWLARVREEINRPEGAGWTSMLNGPTEWASFARFDAEYPVEVSVTISQPFESAQVLPLAANIALEVTDNIARFVLDKPRHITLCVDGNDEHPLHLFCREIESDVPDPDDENVIYFGPGEHWIHSLKVESGQTIYIDGGAILRAVLPEGAKGTREGVLNLTHYHGSPVINIADVEDVRIYGRGIIDGTLLPHLAPGLLRAHNARRVKIEGIMLRNSPNWHLPIAHCADVVVENIACLSGRLNSDGVNCVGSTQVVVRHVFVRSFDDSFVVKTLDPDHPAQNILYENCIAWNDWGYALGVSYETRADIRDVIFRDCEVIFARNWALGIHISDAGTVGPITFERIGVFYPKTNIAPSMSRQLIRLNIGADDWGNDLERGHIHDISFRDIEIQGENIPPIFIHGFDSQHEIETVRFENLRINGKGVLSPDDYACDINEHARNVAFDAA